MRLAWAQADLVLTPEAALRLWTDVDRWGSFVEGFARTLELSPEWPAAGSRVVWESTPAGRGRVTEKGMERDVDVIEERRARKACQVHRVDQKNDEPGYEP